LQCGQNRGENNAKKMGAENVSSSDIHSINRPRACEYHGGIQEGIHHWKVGNVRIISSFLSLVPKIVDTHHLLRINDFQHTFNVHFYYLNVLYIKEKSDIY